MNHSRESDVLKYILSPDELYVTPLTTVSTPTARRNKRMFDIGTALLLLVLSPLLIWFQRPGKRAYTGERAYTGVRPYYGDCAKVLVGRLTWVGYTGRTGVFTPADIMKEASDEMKERLMLRYMRNYRTATDFKILIRNWNHI